MKDSTNKKFWNRSARIYDRYVLEDAAVYDAVYRLMRARLRKDMEALELATGTGLIALNVAESVKTIEATDFSEKMIAAACSKPTPPNVRFCMQDATCLTYPDQCFDAVIISNALHIMPHPEKALAEIRRVLKDGGVLIAPNFTHKGLSFAAKIKAGIAKLFGFGVFSVWSPQEYTAYINDHGFRVQYSRVLKASFPLTYVEAVK
jgi:ubiquinone/menaquinone biosynthesis C-methylase UbiE